MMGRMNKNYKDDYETIYINEEGKEKRLTIYRGPYFEVDLDQRGLTRFRRNNLLLLILIVILHLTAGFVNNRGMYQFYIALPYVIALLPLWNIMSAITNIPKWKDKYRRDEVEPSFDRMGAFSIWLLVCFGVILLGEILFVLFSGSVNLGSETLFFISELIAAAAAFLIFRSQKQLQFRLISEN
jgi:hypothetical protein